MNSSGTVREDGAEGSTVPCLAITARTDMQVEDDIGDLDETQVQEPGSKRHKESVAAKDLLEAFTSKLMQDAVVRDQRMAERMAERDAAAAAALAERDAALAATLEGLYRQFPSRLTPKSETSLRVWMGRWTVSNDGYKNNGRRLKINGRKTLCIPITRMLLSTKRNSVFRWKCKKMSRRGGRPAWKMRARSLRPLLRPCVRK